MRREKTMKICANFAILPSISLKENAGSDRSWVWQCADFSEEKSELSVLAIRFANSENGRTATVTFPCAAGTSYYLFWNAEYLPGRFSFNVGEACSASSCHRAHRKRSRLMFLRRRR